MKRFLIASLSLAIAALVGGAGTATAQSTGTDSVTGTASDCIEFFETAPGQFFCIRRLSLDIAAESGSEGENPTGTVSWIDMGATPGGSASASTEVTCLSVSGRTAIIGVTGSRRFSGQFTSPVAGLIQVVDAGGPDSGADTFQFAIQPGPVNGPPLPGPTTCSSFPGPFPTNSSTFPDFTNETGDIVVVDAQPLPTTKNQCMKSGWQRYGLFKNQGDCVSFVATGGKNPPANSR